MPDRQMNPDLLEPKAHLEQLGFALWHETLMCIPVRYHDYTRQSSIREAVRHTDIVSQPCVFRLMIDGPRTVIDHPKRRLVLTGTDGVDSIRLAVLEDAQDDPDGWNQVEEGDIVLVQGELQNWNGALQITQPRLLLPNLLGLVVPDYGDPPERADRDALYQVTRHALAHHMPAAVDHILAGYPGKTEAEILAETRITAPSIEVILRAAHAPQSANEGIRGQRALRRLSAAMQPVGDTPSRPIDQ